MRLLGAMTEAEAAPLFAVREGATAAWPLAPCLYPTVAHGPSIKDDAGRTLLRVCLVRCGFGTQGAPFRWEVRLQRWRYGRGRRWLPAIGAYRYASREWTHADEAAAREHAARIGAAIERRAVAA